MLRVNLIISVFHRTLIKAAGIQILITVCQIVQAYSQTSLGPTIPKRSKLNKTDKRTGIYSHF